MKVLKILIAISLAAAAAAWAAEEMVVNGGFETGQAAPWVLDVLKVGGRYPTGHAASAYAIYQVSGSARQDLERTIYPSEVIKVTFEACFRIYVAGSDEASPRKDEYSVLSVWLGTNSYGVQWPDENWKFYEFPKIYIVSPFNYCSFYLENIASGHEEPVDIGLDNVSILISPTGVPGTSLGRVKALYY